jgi:hypothetical protein
MPRVFANYLNNHYRENALEFLKCRNGDSSNFVLLMRKSTVLWDTTQVWGGVSACQSHGYNRGKIKVNDRNPCVRLLETGIEFDHHTELVYEMDAPYIIRGFAAALKELLCRNQIPYGVCDYKMLYTGHAKKPGSLLCRIYGDAVQGPFRELGM